MADDHQPVLRSGHGYVDSLWITQEADVLAGVVAHHREYDDAVFLALIAVHCAHGEAVTKPGGPFGLLELLPDQVALIGVHGDNTDDRFIVAIFQLDLL
jgi:hypothetical protein